MKKIIKDLAKKFPYLKSVFLIEYPKDWVIKQKRSWNEAYILRAFLQYNNAFKIEVFNTFLASLYKDFFVENMPLCLKNTGGSIWLKKI